MFNSFSAALSALKAHSAAVDTVGSNLANVNTTGYKDSSVAFKDIVSESIGGGQGEVGMGVNRPETIRNFSQGAIQSTSGALDSAIQGNGFFVVKDGSGARLLTRDGTFQLDKNGYVVTVTGERVQQYADGMLEDIQIPSGALPAQPTSSMSVTANLDTTAAVGETLTTPMEVVDSLGVTHVITLKYTKTDPGTWEVDALIPDNEIGGTDSTLKSLFSSPLPTENTLEFDETGKLTTPSAPGVITIEIPGLTSGANDMSIDLKLHDDKGIALVTQFAQASSVARTFQDGFTAAEVVGVGMADGGRVIARYGNGEEREVAALAMALVVNPGSLSGVGNNMYRATSDSASPTYGVAGAGGRGKIKAGSLEASTVDMAREFTNLIVFQRGYQANSRVITTADEMSQETLNLKR